MAALPDFLTPHPVYTMAAGEFFGDRDVRRALAPLAALILLSSAAMVLPPLLVRMAVNGAVYQSAGNIVVYGLFGAAVTDAFGRLAGELRFRYLATLDPSLQNGAVRTFINGYFENSFGVIHREPPGKIASTLQNACYAVGQFLISVLFVIAPIFLELLFVCVIVAMVISPIIMAVFLAFSVSYTYVVFLTSNSLTRQTNKSVRAVQKLFNYIGDILQNKDLVKSEGATAFAAGILSAPMKHYANVTNLAWRQREAVGLKQAGVIAAFLVLSSLVAGYLYSAGGIGVGDYFLMYLYALAITRPLDALGRSLRDLSRTASSLNLLTELLPDQRVDKAQARLAAPACDLDIRSVSYSYPPSGPPAVSGCSLRVDTGEHVCISGSSGSGKSTILQLIRGLRQPCSGEILIGGKAIECISHEWLAANIVYQMQNAQVFNTTVADNISMGRYYPHKHMQHILCELGLDAGAESLRLDSLVGSGGGQISLGQKQRIVLARSLMREASIYLYDEPTSYLDAQNACRVASLMRRKHSGKTVIVITHDPGIFTSFDRIVAFDEVNKPLLSFA
ncbi:ABC transporter ATP-binding protein [Roseibium sp. FZY0029]|uniref:ABC transporter ATP-binding protein n=1 Tax=Roseibium sp. FZY0029 TaxID=3116647 RepID=UPI002EAD1ED4|nr:ABC transporter ATP-binding protein [Roseibium sp. FZY0029]